MGVDCCTMCGSGLYCGLELNPSSNAGAQRGISGTVHCGGVPYVVVRGDGGGLSIVKPTTPSFALCKYIYIYVFVSHYASAGSTTYTLNKILDHLFVLITRVEFTV